MAASCLSPGPVVLAGRGLPARKGDLMLKEEIVVGKSYVNEGACLIREVIEEVDSRHVKYSAFELDSGPWLPARHSVCSRRDMQRWADREARPHEEARLH